jgi:hypothetical protein
MGTRGAQEVAGEEAEKERGRGPAGKRKLHGRVLLRKGHRRAGEGAVSALEEEGRKEIGIKEGGPKKTLRGPGKAPWGAQKRSK